MDATKKTYRVVGAAIINDKGEVLCAQRGYGSLKGKWEFPGGKIEEGETKEEALKREIREEMQLEITVLNEMDETYFEYDDFSIILSVFRCNYKTGTLKDLEHQSLRWLPKNELLSLDWAPADVSAVKKMLYQ